MEVIERLCVLCHNLLDLMMDTEHRKNFILNFFCIAITCVSVIQYDCGAYEFFNNFCDRYSTRIELVIQPLPAKESQASEHLSSVKPNNNSFSCFLEHLPIHGYRSFFTSHCLIDQFFRNQQVCSPIHHIISILHKKNTWHQSSDDEPLLHNTSLS
jgi:hypothetical protein